MRSGSFYFIKHPVNNVANVQSTGITHDICVDHSLILQIFFVFYVATWLTV